MNFSLLDLARTDFRTSKSADEINSRFLQHLGLTHRYEPARLAIGRSLSLDDQPNYDPVSNGDMGKAIKGENLFGSGGDLATWVALVIEHKKSGELTKKEFQQLIAAHWHRGINLLWREWKTNDQNFDKFLIRLMERAGLRIGEGEIHIPAGENDEHTPENLTPYPIDLMIGDPSIDIRNNEKITWRINGRGNSPHIAIMGTLGTGKTQLAMNMLQQIKDTDKNASVLLFDMGKGDIAEDTRLVEDLKAQVISVPTMPVPLDVLKLPDRTDATINDVALRFRESFSGVSPNRLGGVQTDTLRDATIRVLNRKEQVSLVDIRDEVREIYEEKNRKDDVMISTFNDLCAYSLFTPEMSPYQFFRKNWIIDVHSAPETVQRLVVFLIIDAVNTYLTRLKDTPLDSEGNRALRLILGVDEARKVLGYQQQSLINIVRSSRSKGGSVMLISQSPDDFAQEEENFLENIGLTACFRTNAKNNALRAVFGQQVDLAGLDNGVCVTRIPEKRGVLRVRTWE